MMWRHKYSIYRPWRHKHFLYRPWYDDKAYGPTTKCSWLPTVITLQYLSLALALNLMFPARPQDMGFGMPLQRRLMKPRSLFCAHEDTYTAFLRNMFFSSIRQCRMSKECLLQAILTFWRLKVINVLFCLQYFSLPKDRRFRWKVTVQVKRSEWVKMSTLRRSERRRQGKPTYCEKTLSSAKYHIDWDQDGNLDYSVTVRQLTSEVGTAIFSVGTFLALKTI